MGTVADTDTDHTDKTAEGSHIAPVALLGVWAACVTLCIAAAYVLYLVAHDDTTEYMRRKAREGVQATCKVNAKDFQFDPAACDVTYSKLYIRLAQAKSQADVDRAFAEHCRLYPQECLPWQGDAGDLKYRTNPFG